MPLYEYKCQQCGRLTEKRQKFSDPEITVCPHCSGPLERVISAPAVSFKGSGWYKDLYSSPKPSTSSSTGESGGSATASSNGNSSSSESASPPAASPSSTPASAPASTPAKSST